MEIYLLLIGLYILIGVGYFLLKGAEFLFECVVEFLVWATRTQPKTPPSPKKPAVYISSGYWDDERKTKKREQHEWYGDHRTLDWRDRETAEMFGMSADDYEANYLNS